MNFSGIPEKTFIGRLLRSLLKWIPPETKVPILQGKLKGKKWIVGSGVNGYWLGSFEQEKQGIFIKLVKKEMVVFDIGAHVGFYSLLASQLVGKQGSVIAFEPFSRNLSYLRKHMAINAIKNVKIIDAAVSDTCTEMHFMEGVDSSTGRLSLDGNIKVRTVTLDSLILSGDIAKPDIMKIDVEGAESRVLRGANGLLIANHPMIILATHGNDQHRGCCKLLKELGYYLLPLGHAKIECTNEVLAMYEL